MQCSHSVLFSATSWTIPDTLCDNLTIINQYKIKSMGHTIALICFLFSSYSSNAIIGQPSDSYETYHHTALSEVDDITHHLALTHHNTYHTLLVTISIVKQSKADIAVRGNHLTTTGNRIPYGITHTIWLWWLSHLYPSRSCTRFSDPRGMQGWVDLQTTQWPYTVWKQFVHVINTCYVICLIRLFRRHHISFIGLHMNNFIL